MAATNPAGPAGRRPETRTTAEYIVGGVTGTLGRPTSLLLGRLDSAGRLRYLGQTHRSPPTTVTS
jgi:hypothetical protein